MRDDTASVPVEEPSNEKTSQPSVSLEDVQKAVAWNKPHKVLESRHHI